MVVMVLVMVPRTCMRKCFAANTLLTSVLPDLWLRTGRLEIASVVRQTQTGRSRVPADFRGGGFWRPGNLRRNATSQESKTQRLPLMSATIRVPLCPFIRHTGAYVIQVHSTALVH